MNMSNSFSYKVCKPLFQTIVTELIQPQNFNKSSTVAQTSSDLPIAVEPHWGTNYQTDLPIEAITIRLICPLRWSPLRQQLSDWSAHCGGAHWALRHQLSVIRPLRWSSLSIEAPTISDLPIAVEPIEAQTISDLLIVVEPIEAPTIRLICPLRWSPLRQQLSVICHYVQRRWVYSMCSISRCL
jgi:hypothetical protein